jgi:hypothetical protein
MNARRLTFAIFAASLLVLSPLAFQSKWPLVFYRFDGIFLLIFATMQKIWSLGGWNFTTNPLQGIGALELPQHTTLLDPGLWLAVSLPPRIGPTAAMTYYAALLATITCWLGVRMGLDALVSVAGAWIALLLAFPYVYPSLGFDFLWGDPAYVPLIFLDVAAFLLLLEFGKGPRLADAARFLGLAAICAYQLIQYPNFAPVSGIVLIVFGVASLVMAASMRERMIKLAGAAALAGLALAVFGRLVIGIYGFSKPTYFWYEFFPRPGQLRDLTFFIADHSRWPAWLVYGLSLFGALHAAVRGSGAIRPIARAFLGFLGFNLVLNLLLNQGWKGPRIAYIDIFGYPFYCLFAAYGAGLAANWPLLDGLWQRATAAAAGVMPRLRHGAVPALAVGFLPWLVLIDYRPAPLNRPLVRNLNPYVWPPVATPVSRFLAAEISLRPGSPFRGRIASIAGSDFDPEYVSAPLINQHNYDVMNLFFSGNDHRLYGLWYFGIPTLLECNQFSSPFFHLVNARLLNAAGARDLRSYETQSIANDRIMALLGARYLMSDKLLAGRTPALHHQLVQGRDLYIYSIPAANVAGYSVTQVRRAASAQDAITWLADPSVDLRDAAVLTLPEDLPPLVPASRSSLVVERGGYRVSAESPGTSLLVLPVEYSHCLRPELTSTGGTPPRLLRANLTLAAVLFSGRVEGTLRLRYGPFSSACRIDDWREADALRIGDVREWPKLPFPPQ